MQNCKIKQKHTYYLKKNLVKRIGGFCSCGLLSIHYSVAYGLKNNFVKKLLLKYCSYIAPLFSISPNTYKYVTFGLRSGCGI